MANRFKASKIDQKALIVIAAEDASPSGVALGTVAYPVTLDNANAMAQAGKEFIASSSAALVRIDMHNVEATSVAVAVALAWLAAANRARKELRLNNLSSDFNGVIEFSGIAPMFAEHTGTFS